MSTSMLSTPYQHVIFYLSFSIMMQQGSCLSHKDSFFLLENNDLPLTSKLETISEI